MTRYMCNQRFLVSDTFSFFIIPQKKIQLFFFSPRNKKSYFTIGLGNALITAKSVSAPWLLGTTYLNRERLDAFPQNGKQSNKKKKCRGGGLKNSS